MDYKTYEPVAMLRYVLAYFAVKLAVSGALFGYAVNFEAEFPDVSTPITIIAVSVPILWFAKLVNRPMLGSERLWFAFGNAVAELVYGFAWVFGILWLNGASVGWDGLSYVLGGDGNPDDAKIGLIIGMTVSVLEVAFFSAFFGWLMTKRLPKEKI